MRASIDKVISENIHFFYEQKEIKLKFSSNFSFIHFTTKERAKKIIKQKRIYNFVEGVKKFGPSKIYAVSLQFGHFVPSVQITHILKDAEEKEIIALKFKTNNKPQIIFPEEAIWDEEYINIYDVKVISVEQAKNILNKNIDKKLNDDYSEYIIFESKEDLSQYYYDDNYYLYKNNQKVYLSNSKADLIDYLKYNKPELLDYFGFAAPKKKIPKGYITLYRGIGYNEGNNYYSPSKEFALNFTRTGRESELKKRKIHTSKIYRHDPLPRGYGLEDENFEKAIKIAKRNGQVAIWVDEGINQPDSVFFF